MVIDLAGRSRVVAIRCCLNGNWDATWPRPFCVRRRERFLILFRVFFENVDFWFFGCVFFNGNLIFNFFFHFLPLGGPGPTCTFLHELWTPSCTCIKKHKKNQKTQLEEFWRFQLLIWRFWREESDCQVKIECSLHLTGQHLEIRALLVFHPFLLSCCVFWCFPRP